MKLLPLVLLWLLTSCSSYTEYVDYGSGYARFDCEQSDPEYRLFNQQYHCKGQPVSLGEFKGSAR